MQKLLSPEEADQIFSHMEERFGISPEVFANYILMRGKKKIWMMTKEAVRLIEAGTPIEKWGMRAFTGRTFPYKPSTPFSQTWGHLATKGVVTLNKTQLKKYFEGESNAISCSDGRGAVLISDGDYIVGAAFHTGDELLSQFPASERREMINYYRDFLEL